MDGDILWTVIRSIVDAVEAYFSTEWDLAKVLQSLAACVTIGGGAFGIWQALRFADKRLADRIDGYLKREEDRLKQARTTLLGAIRKTTPGRPKFEPVFSSEALSKALKDLNWGRTKRAEDGLLAALKLIEEKVDTAEERAATHRRQQAAAHLLLGAIADTRKEHLKALDHFKQALDLNPDDVEALEYAGQQLLLLPDPRSAFEYFSKLHDKATLMQDQLLAARSKISKAKSLYVLPKPNLTDANSLLKQVVGSFPQAMGHFERAMAHELHADIRRDASYDNANDSYVEALTCYSRAKDFEKGKSAFAVAGIERVTRKIAALNAEEPTAEVRASGLIAQPTGVPPAIPPPTFRT